MYRFDFYARIIKRFFDPTDYNEGKDLPLKQDLDSYDRVPLFNHTMNMLEYKAGYTNNIFYDDFFMSWKKTNVKTVEV